MTLFARKATSEETARYVEIDTGFLQPEVIAEYKLKCPQGKRWIDAYYSDKRAALAVTQVHWNTYLGYLWIPTQDQMFMDWFVSEYGDPKANLRVLRQACKKSWMAGVSNSTGAFLTEELQIEEHDTKERLSGMTSEERRTDILLRKAGNV